MSDFGRSATPPSGGITILSDADVREVLDTLTKMDILDIHHSLADALHNYSTATTPADSGCCAENQPSRISVKGRDGGNTLFMPAVTDVGLGVKIVTLSDSSSSSAALPARINSLDLSHSPSPSTASTANPTKPPTSVLGQSSRSSSPSTQSASSQAPSSRFTFDSARDSFKSSQPQQDTPGVISFGTPVSRPEPSSTSPKGSVTLLTPQGAPRALINASTLTAFRTALVSCMLYQLRDRVHTMTVFGAGMQAYYHIFVAFLLRPTEIHHLNVINQSFTSAQRMVIALAQSENEAVADCITNTRLRTSIVTPSHVEYARLLKENVRASDVIFCCTPATSPLFPAGHLTNTEGRRKARYIAAIGSYKPHMQELHEDILRQAVRGPQQAVEHQQNHRGLLHMHQRHVSEGGAVIVDTIEGAMREAGEVIKSGIGGEGIVELGELVMLKRTHLAEHARDDGKLDAGDRNEEKKEHSQLGGLFHHGSGGSKPAKARPTSVSDHDGGLKEWLQRGNVIYKSVGLGLMDVVVGMEIVRLAEDRGIGTRVRDF